MSDGLGASYAVLRLRLLGEDHAADMLVEEWKALEAERDRARRLAARYLSEMWQAQSIAHEIQERVAEL